jgi:chromosome partitioning protein
MSIPKSNKPSIIAFAVDKGGVGKTTTCLNTAAGLANLGKRVLMVDTDQQANLTSTFLKDEPTYSLLESLCDESIPLPIVKLRENLDLVPATNRMFGIGLKLIVEMTRSMMSGKPSPDCRGILRRLLETVRNKYDYILIDCPPSDNIMMMNALYAANSVVIVAKPEPYCVRGVQNFVNMMWVVKRDANPSLRLAGILITDYFADATGHRNGEAALRAWAPKFVFSTRIRHSRPLYNAILAHQDIFSYAPDSNGAQDYADFVNELTSRNL